MIGYERFHGSKVVKNYMLKHGVTKMFRFVLVIGKLFAV